MGANMFEKIYLSRKETKAWGMDNPIGDPTGGAAYGEYNDPVSALVVGGSSIVGGIMGSRAARDAANTQANAIRDQIAEQRRQFDIQNEQLAPYRELGYTALNDITGRKDFLTSQFGPDQYAQYLDPSYNFRFQQGQRAAQNAMNAGGGLLSGNTLRGLTEYGQGAASQEYANAFNRFQTERGNIYNTLAGMAGIGQTGQSQANQLAQNYMNAQTQLGVGLGQVQAAGTIGQANAYSNAIGGAGNALALGLMNNNTGGQGYFGGIKTPQQTNTGTNIYSLTTS